MRASRSERLMWDGANPQILRPTTGCFGCRASPFGVTLYSRLSTAREARGRSSPSRVTIADAFLPPQLAAWQAVWRGHRPSRLQGALPMKAPGSIRLGNKRAGAPGKPGPGEIAVDIDRRNRVLGNPFVLHNPSDAAARNDVIERFRAKYEADLRCDGPMSAATEAPGVTADGLLAVSRITPCAPESSTVACSSSERAAVS